MAQKRFLLLTGDVLLLAASSLHAQPSPELTMEIYTSNVQALTSSMLNASVLNESIRRNGGTVTSKGSRTGTVRPTTAKTTIVGLG